MLQKLNLACTSKTVGTVFLLLPAVSSAAVTDAATTNMLHKNKYSSAGRTRCTCNDTPQRIYKMMCYTTNGTLTAQRCTKNKVVQKQCTFMKKSLFQCLQCKHIMKAGFTAVPDSAVTDIL
jgi:hypothetical protein